MTDHKQMSFYANFIPATQSGQDTFGKTTVGGQRDSFRSNHMRVIAYSLPPS